jgi:hypothetical protein
MTCPTSSGHPSSSSRRRASGHRRTLALLLPLTAAFLMPLAAHAQRETATQFHSWYIYQGNHRLNDRWGLHTEYQWRREDWGTTWQQSLARLGLDYHTRSGATLTGGYGWIRSFPYGAQPIAQVTDEHRLWEQWIVRKAYPRAQSQHRVRLEQRWIESPAAWHFQQRVRYRWAVKVPVKGDVFLAAYDEVFAHIGFQKSDFLLDQNRFSTTLGWQLNPTTDLQLGYLNQHIWKTNGLQKENNHTLQLTLNASLDFRHATPPTPTPTAPPAGHRRVHR